MAICGAVFKPRAASHWLFITLAEEEMSVSRSTISPVNVDLDGNELLIKALCYFIYMLLQLFCKGTFFRGDHTH